MEVPATTNGSEASEHPFRYGDEVEREILERLAAGESLLAICRDEEMPAESTVRGWVMDPSRRRPGFAAEYARARILQMFSWADEIKEHADHERDNEDHLAVRRDELKIDARKWLLSKLMPEQFGEYLRAEISAPGGGPVPVDQPEVDFSVLTDEELAQLERLLRKAMDAGGVP